MRLCRPLSAGIHIPTNGRNGYGHKQHEGVSKAFSTITMRYTHICYLLLHVHGIHAYFRRVDQTRPAALLLLGHQLCTAIFHLSAHISARKSFRICIDGNAGGIIGHQPAYFRQLSETCPGTFQHSMQVSNLATEAADSIGAQAQLVRTGALYHDIGKMANPTFFTENQNGVNPHTNLPYEESAQIVISHVKDGVKIAEKLNLPQTIIDFIKTHHGTSKAKYFYNSYVNEHPDEEVNEELFTYPGPNPFTKEQALLMMADAVEAASRSLKEYTEENISKLVNTIIDSQIADGLLNNSPISFRDIRDVKEAFIEKLKTMYHTRISYPELQKK